MKAIDVDIVDQPTYLWRIGTPDNPIYGGLNLLDLEYQLGDNQSPKMVNLWYNNQVLGKRWGQALYREFTDPVGAVFWYQDDMVVAAGETLYHRGRAVYEELESTRGTFFIFNDRLYFINGSQYLEYDGLACKEVEPYIPTIMINADPKGEGGDTTDNYNRLGAGFTVSYSADGTSDEYRLPVKELDETPVTALVDFAQKVEGTDFTVDRAAGTVRFHTIPQRNTNNVEITAYKTDPGARETILACTKALSFGGENATRVFLAGNGTSTYYFSDVTRPDYFPEYNYNVIGDNSGEITGMAQQYDVLVFFKPSEIWQIRYSFDGERATFPMTAVNRQIGCDAPDSIQLVNNSLVWLDSRHGVCILQSTVVQDERNVEIISRNVNGVPDSPGLLFEENMQQACSVDYENKYWLCVNGHVYLWDYSVTQFSAYSASPTLAAKSLAWFYFENIHVHRFLIGDRLYGVNGNGVQVFTDDFRDFGEAFTAMWRMPIRDFNIYHNLKSVLKVWVTVRTDTNSRHRLKYITEREQDGSWDEEDILASSFSWKNFAWDTFTWRVQAFAKTFRRKPKLKKIEYFAMELWSDEAGRDMNISGITVQWREAKQVKA